MMLETLGLIETLEWNVVDKVFLGIENYERPGIKKNFFHFESKQWPVLKNIMTTVRRACTVNVLLALASIVSYDC
jgi:hypothetical protein